MPVKVMTRGGKPLIKQGKVAVSSSGECCGPCGAGGCQPTTECPADSVTVELSGLSFCGGCIATDAGNSLIITAGTINGTYELTQIVAPTICCYEGSFDNGITFDFYSDAGCLVPFGTLDAALEIWAGRYGPDDETYPCKWQVYASLRAVVPDLMLLFFSDPQTSFSDPMPNVTAVCGDPAGSRFHPCSLREWEAIVGESGTATLSL